MFSPPSSSAICERDLLAVVRRRERERMSYGVLDVWREMCKHCCLAITVIDLLPLHVSMIFWHVFLGCAWAWWWWWLLLSPFPFVYLSTFILPLQSYPSPVWDFNLALPFLALGMVVVMIITTTTTTPIPLPSNLNNYSNFHLPHLPFQISTQSFPKSLETSLPPNYFYLFPLSANILKSALFTAVLTNSPVGIFFA